MKYLFALLALALTGCSTPQPVKLICTGPCAMTTDGSNVEMPKIGNIINPGVKK